MANEQNEIVYDGQNRCRRCDRPLKDPLANYGWWCAKLVGLKGEPQTNSLDEGELLLYNDFINLPSVNSKKDTQGNFTTKGKNYKIVL